MNPRDEFNQRWKITEKSTYQGEFQKFKQRLLNIFKDIDRCVLPSGISKFCQIFALPEKWEEQLYGTYTWSENIINALKKEDNDKQLFFMLETIFPYPSEAILSVLIINSSKMICTNSFSRR